MHHIVCTKEDCWNIVVLSRMCNETFFLYFANLNNKKPFCGKIAWRKGKMVSLSTKLFFQDNAQVTQTSQQRPKP